MSNYLSREILSPGRKRSKKKVRNKSPSNPIRREKVGMKREIKKGKTDTKSDKNARKKFICKKL